MRGRSDTASSSSHSQWPPPPPENETPEEKAKRIEAEREAKRVSDAIDQKISEEREIARRKKEKTGAKILLLGQAESGKSTVLKNFQLRFSPSAFEAEAELWRPIIHLNLLRTINRLLEIISESQEESQSKSQDLSLLRLTLGPLKQVEENLDKSVSAAQRLGNAGWRGWLKLRSSNGGGMNKAMEEDISNRNIIKACQTNMIKLWANPEVKRLLATKDVLLQDHSGFFLDDIERVSDENYVPTPDDVMRARVPTLGPEEHHIPIEANDLPGPDVGKEWIIYDVGGSRSQRAAWAQFFDDVTAIIFLAPVSGFNQNLEEDPSINRLADSIALWKQICSNKLLASVHLILFLNKIDILDMQLKRGIQFGKYVTSYRDKATGEPKKNDSKSVVSYLTEVFQAMHAQLSPMRRKVYAHCTCATDTKATAQVITRIQEVILVRILAETNIL